MAALQESIERDQERRRRIAARLDELAATEAELADAPARLDEARRTLVDAGDYRAEHAVAQEQARGRDAAERSLAGEREAHDAAAGRLARLRDTLLAYAGLDDELAAGQAALREHAPAHTTYLQNVALAGKVAPRETDVAAATEAVSAAEAEERRLAAALDEARAGYDAAGHNAAAAAWHVARDASATLRADLRRDRDEAGRLAERRRRLEALEVELAAVRGQRAEDEKLLAFLEYGRKRIEEAGPEIKRTLVRDVASRAAGIFSDILNDHSMHLDWGEEYDITVERAGSRRAFAQLSGGEQMAAAVAVRLALLRQVSDIDIAFFDEPTANLDEARRDALADQIVGVRGFSQIFVISHDDTFERVTDHVVRVRKEAGGSAVSYG